MPLIGIIIAQVLVQIFHNPYWHSVQDGGSVNNSWKWRPVVMSPAHSPLQLQLQILLHSMTLADILGDKNWIQQVLVGLSSSFPINYTCYHYTAVGKYCTLYVQTVEWCQLAWCTMENRFVYFLIVKRKLHSACFTSTAMIQIYILGARLISAMVRCCEVFYSVNYDILQQVLWPNTRLCPGCHANNYTIKMMMRHIDLH